MSISEFSLNLCFWRLFIIEKAMFSVSSADRRCASIIGCSSPLILINGKLPAFRCRSDAPLLQAIVNSWSMVWAISLCLPPESQSPGFSEGQKRGLIGTETGDRGTAYARPEPDGESQSG